MSQTVKLVLEKCTLTDFYISTTKLLQKIQKINMAILKTVQGFMCEKYGIHVAITESLHVENFIFCTHFHYH